MASQRKLIRAQIVAALQTANLPGIGASVYPNRWLPTWETELPAIFVYTDDEPINVFNSAPREYERETQVITEIIMKADNALDDALDDMSDLVENVVGQDPFQNGTCDNTTLKGITLELFSNGDVLMGSLRLTWMMRWFKHIPGDLSGTLPRFQAKDIKYDIAPQDGVIDAEDTLPTDPFKSVESLFLDGTNHISVPSGAKVPANPPFALGTAATFSAWVYPTDLTQARSLFCSFDAGSPNNGFEVGIGLRTLGKLGFYSGSSGGALATEDTGASIQINRWTHVAVTFDGVNVRFYQNGVLTSTVARTEPIGVAKAPLFLGADTNTPSVRRFIGGITQFSIWNTVMSQAQVTELYNSGKPADLKTHSAFANGVAWWELMGPDDSILQIADEFNNNHGAAMNVDDDDLSGDVP